MGRCESRPVSMKGEIMEFREKVREFNRRAEQARKDGYEVVCGKVYVAHSVNDLNAFPCKVCDVMDYLLPLRN